jgi:hypothetical protein
MGVSDQLLPQLIYLRKEPQYPMNKRLGVPLSWSGHLGDEQNLLGPTTIVFTREVWVQLQVYLYFLQLSPFHQCSTLICHHRLEQQTHLWLQYGWSWSQPILDLSSLLGWKPTFLLTACETSQYFTFCILHCCRVPVTLTLIMSPTTWL